MWVRHPQPRTLFSSPKKMGFSSVLQEYRIVLHQLYCVISADCQHDSDKPYVAYHSCSLKTISSCWFLYVWIRLSPAKFTVLEEMHIFSEALPKMHPRQMLAQLPNIVMEQNTNSDEILKCLNHCLFFFISSFNKIWTWQISETTYLENKCKHSLHKLLMAAFVLWTPVML